MGGSGCPCGAMSHDYGYCRQQWKVLVTGIPVDTTANAVLKIAFENNTSGTNLGLFAGTTANFESDSGGMRYLTQAVQDSDF